MHKPTFYPAVGGANQGGNLKFVPTTKVSARDQPSHKALKKRRVGQQDEAAWEAAPAAVTRHITAAPSISELLATTFNLNEDPAVAEFADEDRDAVAPQENDRAIDDDDSDSDGGGSSSEDDEEALKQELAAIKREKEALAAEKMKSERERQLEALAEGLDERKLALQKDWTEDAVFHVNVKDKRDEKPRFVNDAVRSEFHKRFLARFIR